MVKIACPMLSIVLIVFFSRFPYNIEMFFYISRLLAPYFGPVRLLQSYMVLIAAALYIGFFVTALLLPRFYGLLPKDRGRDFAVSAAASAGKPTGSGVVFISIFFCMIFLFFIPSLTQLLVLVLTWFVMLTGYLDDRAETPWGEYRKGLLDLVLSILGSFVIFHFYFHGSVSYWLPFVSRIITIHPALFFAVSIVLLWFSINTTNCTDGVDGLSGSLILLALIALGIIFYFIIGNVKVSEYLLIPHLVDGAQWAVICFSLTGVLMGYLWHNAHPSKVLMGDAGSRALGFFIGLMVIIAGNPFLLLMTSGLILINGGTGLVKLGLLRFFNISIFKTIRFPLHDQMRKNLNWSAEQVLIKFVIIQVMSMLVFFAVLFKIR